MTHLIIHKLYFSPGLTVRIHQEARCIGSEFATWIDVFWREDKPWVVLQLPSGRRTAVPASWTDLDGRFSRSEDRPQILPSGLLELARYCHGLREGPWPTPPLEGPPAGPDVALHEIWFQLSLPDRQRFGHRFSGMVLKALGLRPCPTEEDET